MVRTYHIDRVLAKHGWTRISDLPRKYQKGTTILTCNRLAVTDVDAPSGPLQPFIPAMYAPFATAGLLLQVL